MSNTSQKQAAKQFVKDWTGKGYEKGETQRFWLELLHSVFGIDNPMAWMQFELPVKTITKEKGSDFIDAYITATKVLIEQKGSHVDLSAKAKQSDGAELTPYQQARRYAAGLPLSMAPRWIVACNFTTFEVHDMEHPNDAPEVIQLADLEKEYHRLAFLVDDANAHIKKELEVSIKAGEIVGVLYDKLLAQYKDPSNLESQKALNKLCVRLVFCLYAEDAGIFGNKNMFHDYMAQFPAPMFREQLIKLFRMLDTKTEDRDPYEDEGLLAFPYVNGGMFSGDIEIPRINEEIRQLILQRASDDFDWSLISPTIFGAVFESTLNPDTRRAGGMHYTSIENIHKVIDPLFLDDLKAELAGIKALTVAKVKKDKALAFQGKLASLKFLDPACGSGNFLTESYTSLRRLENEALRIIYGTDRVIGEMADPIRVSINQFYGIEINDFACAVAQTALWIAEAQMMQETDEIVGFTIDPLPLKRYTNIKEGNALRLPWDEWELKEDTPVIYAKRTVAYTDLKDNPVTMAGEGPVYYENLEIHTQEVVTQSQKTPAFYHVNFDYIMGNPPFLGYSIQNEEQKNDLLSVLIDEKGKPYKMAGKVDYVSGWYFKAAQLMQQNPKTHAALVSTNSITQGEQVAGIWEPLIKRYGIHIDFAWRTFIWDSEAKQKAHVHCVIIGFSTDNSVIQKRLFDGKEVVQVNHINPYLIDFDDVFIRSRSKSLCEIPQMVYGNKPTDGGFLFIDEETHKQCVRGVPEIEEHVKRFLGASEFINNEIRYCLWLLKASPSALQNPFIKERIKGVKEYRLASTKKATQDSANYPSLFQEIRQPENEYIIVPRHSSENREYIPIGFVSSDIICGDANQMIPNAQIYHFGVLVSSVHNVWVRVVCGRIKSDYRYSKDIVYNNFPWPKPSETQKAKIEQTAQAILDARALYHDSSLADLYDSLTMPPELRKAHRANDAAVLEAYGFPKGETELEIVKRLFKIFLELTA